MKDYLKIKRKAILAFSATITTISGAIYGSIYYMMPQFIEMLNDVMVTPPNKTLFLIDVYSYFGFLFLIGAIPSLLLISNKLYNIYGSLMLALIILGFVLSLLVLGLTLFGASFTISHNEVV